MNKKIAVFLYIKDITLDGGSERKTTAMANEFIKLYDHVTIISRFSTHPELRHHLDPKVKLYFIEERGTPHTVNPDLRNPIRGLLYSYKYAKRITKPIGEIIRKQTPENHTPFLLALGHEVPLPLRKIKNLKIIGVDTCCAYVWKTNRLSGKLYMRAQRWIHRSTDIVGVLSDLQLEDWAVLKRPVRILTNFVANIPETVVPHDQRERTVVAAGRMMDAQKGFDRLIECYASIAPKFPDWKLRIFGDGPLKADYQKLIDEMQMNDYIELLPFSSNIYSEFGKASIFAMSSRWEGFGLVTAEAMACGAVPVAIAATKPSGTSFILRNLPQCLAPENDTEEFTRILEQMMCNDDLRQQTASKARKEVQERFATSVLIKTWSDLFDELAVSEP